MIEKLKMLYKIRPDHVLVKIVRSDNHKFEAIMVPDKIMKYILHEAHERLGNPGSVKLYLFLRKMYYWPQLKRDCTRHVRTCVECQQNNLKEPHYIDFSYTIPKFPFSYIAMDLIGPFEITSNGATRCLTCMCLLTGFLFTVPIPDKRAEKVINAYLRNVYCITGGSKYILSDRGTEFTSKTFKEIIDRLQLTQTFTSLRNPKANSILDAYLKQGMRKLKANNPMIEWDFTLCVVTHSYNITPHTLLGECPFYLFFNRDPYIPGLQKIISYNLHYYGENTTMHLVEAMQIMYQDIRERIIKMRDRSPPDISKLTCNTYKVGDMVLHRNPPEAEAVLGSRYSPCYRIVKIINEKVADIRDPHGHVRRATFEHLQPMNMSKYLLSAEPHTQSFSTSAKFCKEWLQKDNLADIETHKCIKVTPNTANEVRTVPSGLMRQETKHPYFL